jgi:hypothetical protein
MNSDFLNVQNLSVNLRTKSITGEQLELIASEIYWRHKEIELVRRLKHLEIIQKTLVSLELQEGIKETALELRQQHLDAISGKLVSLEEKESQTNPVAKDSMKEWLESRLAIALNDAKTARSEEFRRIATKEVMRYERLLSELPPEQSNDVKSE